MEKVVKFPVEKTESKLSWNITVDPRNLSESDDTVMCHYYDFSKDGSGGHWSIGIFTGYEDRVPKLMERGRRLYRQKLKNSIRAKAKSNKFVSVSKT